MNSSLEMLMSIFQRSHSSSLRISWENLKKNKLVECGILNNKNYFKVLYHAYIRKRQK